MAWLFLDSHERGVSRVGWIGGEKRQKSALQTLPGSAGLLLSALAKDRKRLLAADGICVVSGPGSFSSVRTGVLYANLLSRLLHIPLIGVTVEEANNPATLFKKLQAPSSKLKVPAYVAPVYDAEPNITVPRP